MSFVWQADQRRRPNLTRGQPGWTRGGRLNMVGLGRIRPIEPGGLEPVRLVGSNRVEPELNQLGAISNRTGRIRGFLWAVTDRVARQEASHRRAWGRTDRDE
ncbi:unnamed protein product [Linum trigynum]|uniref:Uncharacterized protein n=1 Tax=Linum trigynum TaxID=586398 RepID=A0AAV2F477_9ROSI